MKVLKLVGVAALAIAVIAWYFSMDGSQQRWIGLWLIGGSIIVYAATQWDKSQDRAAETRAAVSRMETRLERIHEDISSIDDDLREIRLKADQHWRS